METQESEHLDRQSLKVKVIPGQLIRPQDFRSSELSLEMVGA